MILSIERAGVDTVHPPSAPSEMISLYRDAMWCHGVQPPLRLPGCWTTTFADAKKEMLPYHQAVSMLKYVIDKAPAGPCLVDEWTRLTAIDFYSIYKFLAMTFTSRFIVGEYGCLGTVQLRKPVSCISMADDFPFAHPGAVGIGLVLFDADVIVGV